MSAYVARTRVSSRDPLVPEGYCGPYLPTTIPGIVVALTHKGYWSITHQPSGLAIGEGSKDIRDVIPALPLLDGIDWTRTRDELANDDNAKAANRAATRLVKKSMS